MSTPGIKEFRAQDYAAALPLLKQSAEGGNAEAQCMLGNIYQLGLGETGVDEQRAIAWYYRSANQGYGVATSNLAGMVWPTSSEAAAALYQLAREQGATNVPAMTA